MVRQNLRGGSFETISPEPPTPYEDASFDLVIGCSVFTHLARAEQLKWMREIRRILRPGGLLVASTHGAGLFERYLGPLPRAWRERRDYLRKKLRFAMLGIYDAQLDPALDGVAPPGYYRAVFQSARHVRSAWSRELELIEHVDRGLGGYQDLAVLRR
jgi:SAM-dependent methyltransferase